MPGQVSRGLESLRTGGGEPASVRTAPPVPLRNPVSKAVPPVAERKSATVAVVTEVSRALIPANTEPTPQTSAQEQDISAESDDLNVAQPEQAPQVSQDPPGSAPVDIKTTAPDADGEAPIGEAAAAQAADGAKSAEPVAEEEPVEPSPAAAVAPATLAVSRRAGRSTRHQPARAASDNAIAASNEAEVTRRRGAQQAGMAGAEEAEATGIDQSGFETALREAIRRAMPDATSEDDAREVMAEGGRSAAESVDQTLQTQQSQATGNLPAAVSEDAVPPTASQDGGIEVELVSEEVGEPPAPVSAGPVVPPPSTDSAIDVSENRAEVDQLEADNNITRDQLESGNDPQFQTALGARGEAETHDREAPAHLREAEAADRNETRVRASGSIGQTLTGFHSERAAQLGSVANQQIGTQGLSAQRKAEITSDVETIGRETREAVTTILTDMSTKATEDFRVAIEEALEDYDSAFAKEKGGFFTSVGDFLTGDWGDERFNRALALGRAAFERRIERAITDIAAFVEKQLAAARARVAEGRTRIDTYMTDDISEAEREFAEQATSGITADFESLEGEINSARDTLVSSMVDIYRDGIERRNAREEELREANKSIWQRVYDATVGVIQKIIEFKNMLLGILARAAGVVEAIIQDPIGFLSNLIAGIGAGLERFMSNIVQNLQQALMGWLFGALEGAGLKLPERFDMAGFLDIVLQVLGLTKENVRARAVSILGEGIVSKIETAIDFLRILFTEGPAGIWQMLLEQLGNLKDAIIDEIKSWVITSIIEAGIKWIIGLLNPASAFVKACMMIYDIVVFFIERGQQIISAVNAIINALGTIVAGNISAMAQAVEGALNRILPVVIGFLASLLGLGGISDRIRSIIQAIQAPVNRAIDWVINLGVSMARRIAGLFGGDQKDDEEQEQAVDPEVQARIDAGLLDLRERNTAMLDSGAITLEEAENVAASVKQAHPVFKSVEVEIEGESISYAWSANPGGDENAGRIDLGTPPAGVAALSDDEWQISPAIEVSFNVREKFIQRGLGDEYQSQLDEQSEGLNRMNVAEWLANRAAYEQRAIEARAARAAGDRRASARDPRGAAEQQAVRDNYDQRRFTELLAEIGSDPANADLSDEHLVDLVETALEDEMSELHALHNPDQIAGGHYDSGGRQFMRMGSSGVNSSIGAQWRHVPVEERARAQQEIDSDVLVEDRTAPRSRVEVIQQGVENIDWYDLPLFRHAQQQKTQMNVRLVPNFM